MHLSIYKLPMIRGAKELVQMDVSARDGGAEEGLRPSLYTSNMDIQAPPERMQRAQ